MTTKERKEIVKELHAAAERIGAGDTSYCCGAIHCGDTREIFIELFKADAKANPDHRHDFWFREQVECIFSPEVRARRVFGLLWCAELVKDGFFG